MLADSHCHLDDPQFDADRDAVIERARAAGVERLLAVGTGSGPPDLEAGIRIAERWPHIWATVGVHPHDAGKAVPETFERVRELLGRPKVVAAGEIGLDYHYDFSPREVQRKVFARQVEIARAAGKPIVIHTREAWADTLSVLGPGPHQGIFHCFSGGPEEAEQALELGFYISFSGVVTFPKAVRVQQAVRIVPANRLLIETDAPYLAPAPRRGKRNEPAFVIETARKVAELRGETFERVASVTGENFARVLGIE